MNDHQRKVMFSRGNDEWGTPDSIYNGLDKVFHFTLDPCSAPEGILVLEKVGGIETEVEYFTKPKCSKFYTMEDDGLNQDWTGETVFINPPYSGIKCWIEKAWKECRDNDVTSVLLVPARTETKWFKTAWEHASGIYFYHKRIKFLKNGKEVSSPPFPSVAIEFSPGIKDQSVFCVDHNFK